MDIDLFLDQEIEHLEEEVEEQKEDQKKEIKKEEASITPDNIFKDIHASLLSGNIEKAEELYSGLWSKIIKESLRWDQENYDLLLKVNTGLNKSLRDLEIQTKNKISEIRQLIDSTKQDLNDGNEQEAVNNYNKIDEEYHMIPNLFINEKKDFYIKEVLPLYSQLINKTEEKFSSKLKEIESRIKVLVMSIKKSIKKGNNEQALHDYSECISLFNSLPEGYLVKKISLAGDILEIYKETSIIHEIKELNSKLEPELREQFLPKTVPVKPSLPKNMPLPPSPPRSKKQKIDLNKDKLVDTLIRNKLERAHIKIERGNERGADKDLKGVLRLDPDNKEAKHLIHRPHIEKEHRKEQEDKPKTSLHKDKHLAKPKEGFKPAKKKEISSGLKEKLVQNKLERAQIRISRGKREEALADLHSVLKIDPGNSKAREMIDKAKQDQTALKDENDDKNKQEIIQAKNILKSRPKKIGLSQRQAYHKPVAGKSESLINKKDNQKHNVSFAVPAKISDKLRKELVVRKLERAELRIKKGKSDDAVKDLKDVLRLDPENIKAKELMSKISKTS